MIYAFKNFIILIITLIFISCTLNTEEKGSAGANTGEVGNASRVSGSVDMTAEFGGALDEIKDIETHAIFDIVYMDKNIIKFEYYKIIPNCERKIKKVYTEIDKINKKIFIAYYYYKQEDLKCVPESSYLRIFSNTFDYGNSCASGTPCVKYKENEDKTINVELAFDNNDGFSLENQENLDSTRVFFLKFILNM